MSRQERAGPVMGGAGGGGAERRPRREDERRGGGHTPHTEKRDKVRMSVSIFFGDRQGNRQ